MSNFPSCPVSGCKSKLASNKQAMCSAHWDLISESTQLTIKSLKKDRQSKQYTEAISRAVLEAETKEKEDLEIDAYIRGR